MFELYLTEHLFGSMMNPTKEQMFAFGDGEYHDKNNGQYFYGIRHFNNSCRRRSDVLYGQ